MITRKVKISPNPKEDTINPTAERKLKPMSGDYALKSDDDSKNQD
jgi:hypothetical protein